MTADKRKTHRRRNVISYQTHTSHYARKDRLLCDKSTSRDLLSWLSWYHLLRHSLPIARDQRLVGLGDFDTTGSTKSLLDVTVDGELTSSQGTNHEKTSTDTTE
jgi:hypothetical protein